MTMLQRARFVLAYSLIHCVVNILGGMFYIVL